MLCYYNYSKPRSIFITRLFSTLKVMRLIIKRDYILKIYYTESDSFWNLGLWVIHHCPRKLTAAVVLKPMFDFLIFIFWKYDVSLSIYCNSVIILWRLSLGAKINCKSRVPGHNIWSPRSPYIASISYSDINSMPSDVAYTSIILVQKVHSPLDSIFEYDANWN